MPPVTRCAALLLLLLATAASYAKEPDEAAALTRTALDSLLTRLEEIAHDGELTTAQKAVVSGTEMDKFNQQYKGKPLLLRLKVQDVVPYGQGHYVTANAPDLERVQFPTSKFHVKLAPSDVMTVGKDSVLVLRAVGGVMQPRVRFNPPMLETGNSFSFPLRANYSYRVCLDGISCQLESGKAGESKTAAVASPGYSSPGYSSPGYVSSGSAVSGSAVSAYRSSTDTRSAESTFGASGKTLGGTFGHTALGSEKGKNENAHSVDDIKSFFLKGLLASQRAAANKDAKKTGGTTGATGNSANRSGTSASGAGTSGISKIKHNHIYTAGEVIRKFGAPTSRKSTTTTETWTYKCQDGVVHLQFTSLGYAPGGRAATMSDRLRLEVTSVDASSGLAPGGR